MAQESSKDQNIKLIQQSQNANETCLAPQVKFKHLDLKPLNRSGRKQLSLPQYDHLQQLK